MDTGKLLRLVDSRWHDDVRSLLTSGIVPSEEFAEYLNTNFFCQVALSRWIESEYRILDELAQAKILRPFLETVDLEWQSAAVHLVRTGEYIEGFPAYLKSDPRRLAALGVYLMDSQLLNYQLDGQEIPVDTAEESTPQTTADMFAQEIQKLHQRWMREDFGT